MASAVQREIEARRLSDRTQRFRIRDTIVLDEVAHAMADMHRLASSLAGAAASEQLIQSINEIAGQTDDYHG